MEEKIGIYKAKSELKRYENELSDAENRKYNILDILDKLDPRVKAVQPKQEMVSSSRDTTKNSMLSYAIAKEKYAEELIMLDLSIEFYKNEIKRLNKFIEKEISRLNEFNEWEQKIIYMREAKNTWLKIACSVPYSEKTCRIIYDKYKKSKKR